MMQTLNPQMMQTLDQRILQALDMGTIQALTQDDGLVNSLPALIRRSGLIQTTLFLQARAGKSEPHKLMFTALSAGLEGASSTSLDPSRLAALDAHGYLALQNQAEHVAGLISRLVAAEAARKDSQ